MRALMPALAAIALGGACTGRNHCGIAARLELRDGQGALELRVADASGGGGARAGDLDLCDPAGQRLGALSWDGDALRLLDRDGTERERILGLEVHAAHGSGLRLYRGDHVLRVLKPDGVPWGVLSAQGGDQIFVSGPSGALLAKVGLRGADAVVRSAEGVTEAYLVPSPGLEAAAFFALEALPLQERALLAVHVARDRFRGK